MQQRLDIFHQAASKLGFEPADESCITKKLQKINPDGITKLRDSILLGTSTMLQFRMAAERFNLGQYWNFIHLIITDGEDQGSSTTLKELGESLQLLQSVLPQGFLKTIYIGVDIENNALALKELERLQEYGGDSAELYSVDDTEIDDIFQKISINLGIRTQTHGIFIDGDSSQSAIGLVIQQNQAIIQVERKRYMVLFNIDRSGSMKGDKWTNLCYAVEQFLKQLHSDDLVCGLVFNKDAEVLKFMDIESDISQSSQISYNQLLTIVAAKTYAQQYAAQQTSSSTPSPQKIYSIQNQQTYAKFEDSPEIDQEESEEERQPEQNCLAKEYRCSALSIILMFIIMVLVAFICYRN